jgi:iron complex outermembrane recepter protein
MSSSTGVVMTSHTARQFSSAASAIALSFALSGTAFAQAAATAPEAEAEVVVVTGIRASLQNAINVKKNLAVIAETVSAEDIGKLPDVSIAESIARLPGLAAERVDGRSARVSIRGLGSDLTSTLLNGREQVSTNDGRGIELDQFPSELINGVNVYKTTQSSLAAQGIGGTIDMRTIKPLAYGRRAVVVSARYQWNSLGEIMPDVDPQGYRLTGSYVDQFMDGKLGVALGVTTMRNPSGSQRTEAYDTSTTNAKTSTAAGVTRRDSNGNEIGLGANVKSPGGLKVNASSTLVDRTGYMGVLEFKPTDNLSMTVDAYYSTFSSEQNNRGVEVNLGQGVNAGWVAGTTRTTDGYVTEGTFYGRYAVRNIFNSEDAEVAAFGFHTDYNFSEATKIGFDFGYSSATRDTFKLETQPCVGGGCTGSGVPIGYKLNSNGSINLTISENMADPSRVLLADPYNWGERGYTKNATIDDELMSFRLDLSHELKNGAVKSIEVGAHYSDRTKDRTFREGFLATANNANVTIPSSAIVGTVDLGFGGLGKVLAFDPRAVIDSGVFKYRDNISNQWWQAQNDGNVSEKVTTVYFKANVDTTFASIPTTGNFGVQYVHTDQSSDGFTLGYFVTQNGVEALIPRTDGDTYGEWLPSLNLNFEVSDDLYVRLGAGRVLSRANMEEMRSTRKLDTNFDRRFSTDPYNSFYTINGGNPQLRPTIATALDVSVEKYFGRKGYVSLAAWHKNLETYIRPGGAKSLVDLSGFQRPSWISNADGFVGADLKTALLTVSDNGEGGILQGLEFSLSLPFELISERLDGFGATFNVAKNFSEVEYSDSRAGTGELPGFSDLTGNLAVYYEKHGFQARVNTRYRSSFLQEVVNFQAQVERRVSDPETIVDAQIGYEFPATSPLKGLSVLLTASNLNAEPWVTYYDDPYRGLNYDEFGTTYQLGLTYKF